MEALDVFIVAGIFVTAAAVGWIRFMDTTNPLREDEVLRQRVEPGIPTNDEILLAMSRDYKSALDRVHAYEALLTRVYQTQAKGGRG